MRVMKNFNSHCKNCKDRTVGCHSTCETYKADKERYDSEMEIISKNESYAINWKCYLAKKKGRTFKR